MTQSTDIKIRQRGTETPHDAAQRVVVYSRYHSFEAKVNHNIGQIKPDDILFNLKGDWGAIFLSMLPAHLRQEYNCRACLRFLDDYAGIVKIDEMGEPTFVTLRGLGVGYDVFSASVRALMRAMSQSRVVQRFIPSSRNLGVGFSGGYSHLSGELRWTPTVSPEQDARDIADHAQRVDAFKSILPAMSLGSLNDAFEIASLTSRPGKVKPALGTLITLTREWQKHKYASGAHKLRLLALWAVRYPNLASRSTVAFELYQRVRAGEPPHKVVNQINAMLDPSVFMRPTTVKAGALKAAEDLFSQADLRRALGRRPARSGDVGLDPVWAQSAPLSPVFPGVFPTKPKNHLMFDSNRMTWARFALEVLPTARSVKVWCAEGHYYSFLTATDLGARPVVKWDQPAVRCPITWSVNLRPVSPRAHGVLEGWVDVPAIFKFPNGSGYLFALQGARCVHAQPLFPEFLASDLHAHRAVVEAWASQNLVSGTPGDLVGPAVRDGHPPVRLLVTGRLAAREVIIDSLM